MKVNRLLPIAALIALAFRSAPAEARTTGDPWWGTDKALHLAVGIGVGAGCYGTLYLVSSDRPALRTALCGTLGQIPGVAKELYDSGRPGNDFSAKDLLWTAVGVLASSLALYAIERLAGTESREGSVSKSMALESPPSKVGARYMLPAGHE